MLSGQPFLDLLRWHPRDVDTLDAYYREQAEEQRLQQARAHAQSMMG